MRKRYFLKFCTVFIQGWKITHQDLVEPGSELWIVMSLGFTQNSNTVLKMNTWGRQPSELIIEEQSDPTDWSSYSHTLITTNSRQKPLASMMDQHKANNASCLSSRLGQCQAFGDFFFLIIIDSCIGRYYLCTSCKHLISLFLPTNQRPPTISSRTQSAIKIWTYSALTQPTNASGRIQPKKWAYRIVLLQLLPILCIWFILHCCVLN